MTRRKQKKIAQLIHEGAALVASIRKDLDTAWALLLHVDEVANDN